MLVLVCALLELALSGVSVASLQVFLTLVFACCCLLVAPVLPRPRSDLDTAALLLSPELWSSSFCFPACRLLFDVYRGGGTGAVLAFACGVEFPASCNIDG